MYKIHEIHLTSLCIVRIDKHITMCYYVATIKAGGSERVKTKRLINRLVRWLREFGISPDKIAECIEYITK